MPRYEYKCPSCGHEFEEVVAVEKRNSVLCQECYWGFATRLFSKPAISFKGAGFYSTDNKLVD